MPLGTPFTDPGVRTADPEGSLVNVAVTGGDAVRTDAITLPPGTLTATIDLTNGAASAARPPFTIVYTATDASGNAASTSRTVSVYDACAPLERWCANVGLCSVSGVCLAFNPCSSAAHSALFPDLCRSANAASTGFAAVADTIAPWISVLGSGPLAAAGPETYVRYTYTTAAPTAAWRDPGVRAEDNLDGDISGRVAVFGVKALQTEWVTEVGAPNVLTYLVRDAAGNEAVPQQRWVFVACAAEERECPFAPGRRYCSTAGACMEPQAPLRDTPPTVTLLVRTRTHACDTARPGVPGCARGRSRRRRTRARRW